VYVGGDFTSVGEGLPRACLAAFDRRTGAATDWRPRANGPVHALAILGHEVWIGGGFTTIDDEPHRGLAAVNRRSGAPWRVGLDTDGQVFALAPQRSTVYVGGVFTHVGGTDRSNLASVDGHTGAVTAWNPGVNGVVRSLAAEEDVLYVGGSFSMAGGGATGSTLRSCAAAFDARTGEILDWDPNANGQVMAIAPARGRIYLGGEFSRVGESWRMGLAAVDSDHGVLQPWNPGLGNYDGRPHAEALALRGRTLYVGGRFQFLDGQWRFHFGAVDALTGIATPWDPRLNGTVIELTISGNTLYAGGSISTLGAYARDNLAAVRLSQDVCVRPESTAAVYATADPLSPSLDLAPNPSRAGTAIRFTLPAVTSIALSVHDVAGRCVRTLIRSEPMAAGVHELRLDTSRWPSGVYWCRMEADGRTFARKLLVAQ
jgi:hypothetical protein